MIHLTTVLRTFLVGIRINLSDGRSHPFVGLFIIIIGLLNLCKPEEMWYMSTGWQLRRPHGTTGWRPPRARRF